MNYTRVLLLCFLLSSQAFAKLPPKVLSVFPADTLATDSEIWLYGPSLAHYEDNIEVEFKQESDGSSILLELKASRAHDYSGYNFQTDWSDGAVGDRGELDLLIARPQRPLVAGNSYTLSSESTEAVVKTVKEADFGEFKMLELSSAQATHEGGFEHDGSKVWKVEVNFVPVSADSAYPVRIEIAEESAEEPFGFTLLNTGQSSLVTLGGADRIKARFVDGKGRVGPWSAAVEVSYPSPYGKVVVAVLVLVGFFLLLGRRRGGK